MKYLSGRSTQFLSLCIAIMVFVTLILAPPSQAQTSRSVIIGTTDMPLSVDPANAIDMPSWELLTHLYTGLTRQIPGTLDYALALAVDYTISEDGMTHVFTVSEDATFDDGTPITAETFANSISRVINLGREGADYINRYIVDVQATNDNEVVFELQMPIPDFDAMVALPLFYPQHPDSYPASDILALSNAENIIGNGPYVLVNYLPGQSIVLDANPAYAHGPQPVNERVIIMGYTLPIDLRLALAEHRIDIAWRALAEPDLEAITDLEAIVIEEAPSLQTFYYLLNHNVLNLGNNRAFDDEVVRQAFTLLLDRNRAIERGYNNLVDPLFTIVPDALGDSTAVFPSYDYEQAELILEEGGYRRLRRTVNTAMTLSTDTYGDLMGSAANELVRGIEEAEIVDISGLSNSETTPFVSAINRGEYLSAIIGWTPPFTSPAGYLLPLAYSEALIPSGAGYGNTEINALLAEAATSTDDAQKAALFDAIQHIILEDANLIPLWQERYVVAYWDDVSGVAIEANGWLQFGTISK